MKTKFAALLFFLATCAGAHAQITLSFTGTANAAANGFTLHQSATFTFTLNENYVQGPSSNFIEYEHFWLEDANSSAPLFTAVGGAITGALSPTDPGYNTYLYITPGLLEIYIADASGLFLNGTPLTALQLLLVPPPELNFLFSALDGKPTTYLTSYLGHYDAAASDSLALYGATTGFTLTTFDIGASAIPEPSTYAALAGLGALGLAIWRKRRSSAPLAA